MDHTLITTVNVQQCFAASVRIKDAWEKRMLLAMIHNKGYI